MRVSIGRAATPLAAALAVWPGPVWSKPIGSVPEVVAAIGACWRPPAGLARLEQLVVTARFGLRRDGTVMGEPRITFSSVEPDTQARLLLEKSARAAIADCTPLVLDSGLAGTIAGRPLIVRFTYRGPKGQGA